MSLNVTVKIRPLEAEPSDRLPAGRRFGFLLHDFDLNGLSRPSRNDAPPAIEGLPETVKTLNPTFMALTERWQLYWVDLFSLSRYDKLYDQLTPAEEIEINMAFRSATKGDRAFTNGHGWDDGYKDYINRVNLDAKPMEQETINCGGNVVELLSDIVRVSGVQAYQVATLDGNRPPPDPLLVNHRTAPWLVFKATISRRVGYDPRTGNWAREDIVIPFDQLEGHDVPIPFMGLGTSNYIEAARILVLSDQAPVPDTYRR